MQNFFAPIGTILDSATVVALQAAARRNDLIRAGLIKPAADRTKPAPASPR